MRELRIIFIGAAAFLVTVVLVWADGLHEKCRAWIAHKD